MESDYYIALYSRSDIPAKEEKRFQTSKLLPVGGDRIAAYPTYKVFNSRVFSTPRRAE